MFKSLSLKNEKNFYSRFKEFIRSILFSQMEGNTPFECGSFIIFISQSLAHREEEKSNS